MSVTGEIRRELSIVEVSEHEEREIIDERNAARQYNRQAVSLKPYLDCIRSSLTASLCLRNFSSQQVERCNKPEVEFKYVPTYDSLLLTFAYSSHALHFPPPLNTLMTSCRGNRELILNPMLIRRNDKESCLIEPSVNSVRISVQIRQNDELDKILCDKFTRFLMQRAEEFGILRRKPVEGYDISFLITNFHTEDMWRHKVVDFVIQFMEEVDSELRYLKISVNARSRLVVEEFMKEFVET